MGGQAWMGVGVCLIMIVLIFIEIHKFKTQMSGSVRRTHWNLVISLIVQASIPFFCGIVPTSLNLAIGIFTPFNIDNAEGKFEVSGSKLQHF
jgi:hypothetical protein